MIANRQIIIFWHQAQSLFISVLGLLDLLNQKQNSEKGL